MNQLRRTSLTPDSKYQDHPDTLFEIICFGGSSVWYHHTWFSILRKSKKITKDEEPRRWLIMHLSSSS